MISPREFQRQLEIHDWYYQMSDDPRVFCRGQQNEARLKAIAATSPQLQKLYSSYQPGGKN